MSDSIHNHTPPQNSSPKSMPPPTTNWRNVIFIIIAAAVSFGAYFLLPYDTNVNKGLAILLFIGFLWLTEAVHITVTALLIPVLAVVFQIPDMNTKTALSNFADPVIYVFFGGFALASALHVQQLDRKIALKVIALSRGNLFSAILLIFAVTAFLSMWISNTATAAMMLPLSMGLLSHLNPEKDRNTFTFVLLGIAYCASLGGIGTLVGSPPNAIAAKALGVDFTGWMKLSLPIALVLLPAMLLSLYVVLRPNLHTTVSLETETIPWTLSRVLTVCVAVATALAWIFSSYIAKATGITSIDSIIALIAAAMVVILGTVSWRDVAKNTDLGVLLLFGGGITLSVLMSKSGASSALGNEVAQILSGASPLVIIVAVATFIILLTNFTSNTASAALFVPMFATIATQMGLPEQVLVLIIGIGASCAFMLPVGTPPNALVFATGQIRQKDMVNVGFVLSVLSIAILSAWAWLFLM
ncbi:SLC13 family permease [Wielerella bovis]|uniref:SLC13 family permease n=1 Tax=Wielerella bovis TaxID=2917790 RepID=UPI003D26EAF0